MYYYYIKLQYRFIDSMAPPLSMAILDPHGPLVSFLDITRRSGGQPALAKNVYIGLKGQQVAIRGGRFDDPKPSEPCALLSSFCSSRGAPPAI